MSRRLHDMPSPIRSSCKYKDREAERRRRQLGRSKRAGTSPVNARQAWKGRSIFSRATENVPAFCECFVCTNKYTVKCRPSWWTHLVVELLTGEEERDVVAEHSKVAQARTRPPDIKLVPGVRDPPRVVAREHDGGVLPPLARPAVILGPACGHVLRLDLATAEPRRKVVTR